jgi:hypothetical protein
MSSNAFDLLQMMRAVASKKPRQARESYGPGDRMPERHLLKPIPRQRFEERFQMLPCVFPFSFRVAERDTATRGELLIRDSHANPEREYAP